MMTRGKPSIVVVDDDRYNLEVTARGLVRAGYKVHKFSDPIMALQHIEHDRCDECDVLISDVRMPIMNGFQLARRIKELRQGMKIFLMTESEIEKRDFVTVFPSTSINQLIRKPIDLTELVNRIEETWKEFDRTEQTNKAKLPNS